MMRNSQYDKQFFYGICPSDIKKTGIKGWKYMETSEQIGGYGVKHVPERHVVLVEPEIHWNTGNIGRTCLGAGAFLHLVKPLGFSLDSSKVKRAGLDYWDFVKLSVWENFAEFENTLAPQPGEMAFFAKLGRRSLWELPRPERLFLVFGSETVGLDAAILENRNDHVYHIPVSRQIRSLNLSTAVGIALYESLRETGFSHSWGI